MLEGVHSIEICSLHLWWVLEFWNETWYFLLPLCKDRAVRTLLTQQPPPGLWHFWLHVEVLIQQCLSPAADTVSKQWYWHHCKCCLALAEQFAPNPSISDRWMNAQTFLLTEMPRVSPCVSQVPAKQILLWAEHTSLLHLIAISLSTSEALPFLWLAQPLKGVLGFSPRGRRSLRSIH